MKTDALLYECIDELTREEAQLLEDMLLVKANTDERQDLNCVQSREEENAWKRQENLTMDKINSEMRALKTQAGEENAKGGLRADMQEDVTKSVSKFRLFDRRRLVLLAATFILMFGMVGFAKEHDWDIQMADMLGLTEVMEELEGGYVKVDVSDTSDNITVTASQLIGDKNCMWLQLDTDVPWTVEEGGYYFFGDSSSAECYHQQGKLLTGGQTFHSFNNGGYISFMWQFEDYSDINRATIEIRANQLVEYKPLEKEEDEQITNVISEGSWELKWENCYAANTVTKHPFKKVTLHDGNTEVDCVIHEVEVSPISIQIKGWKSPLDDEDHSYNLLEAVKLKDGTVIECSGSVGGVSNFTVEAFLSKDYAPEIDMTEIEYVVIGGEDIRIARSKDSDEKVDHNLDSKENEMITTEGGKQTMANQKKYIGETFTFYKADPENLPSGTHNIINIYDMEYDGKTGGFIVEYDSSYHSLFIGQLLTLFGEADYTTSNNEDLLSYVVAAEKEDGSVIYLEVYYGPSGPAVGGLDGEDYELAARELEQLIMSAKASDFEIESVYEDYGITLKMGVKDGKGYYENVLSEDIEY